MGLAVRKTNVHKITQTAIKNSKFMLPSSGSMMTCGMTEIRKSSPKSQ